MSAKNGAVNLPLKKTIRFACEDQEIIDKVREGFSLSSEFNKAFKAGDGKLKIFTSEIGYNNSVSQILDDLERHSFQL